VPRILLLATTTGYQTRAFGEAAERLGVDLVFATDRCHQLDDPWQDRALPVRFYDEHGSTASILDASSASPLDGVVAVGDRPTVIAARVLEALGLPGHPPAAAMTARNKLLSRERFRDAGLPVPAFVAAKLSSDPHALAESLTFPCVIKPLELSGSRGVMRVDSRHDLVAAFYRLRALLQSPDIRAERRDDDDTALIEGFIEGAELALEGVMNHGRLQVLALFDKPDPLDGPFFEETIYVTPTARAADTRLAIEHAVSRAARAIGLRHGPVHAECRVNARGVFVLEVAARPIGGLCARSLRFVNKRTSSDTGAQVLIPLEELLLRHALGESTTAWQRENCASGVMMIPIPRRGIFRRVEGLDQARRVNGINDLRITAKTDQVLTPLPEGASYLGFIFAHGPTPEAVTERLRQAHSRLGFTIDQEVPVLQSRHG
jgi:biotin carboxylase